MKLLKLKKRITFLLANPLDTEKLEENIPALKMYGTDLTMLAKKGKLEECFGREQELLNLMEILVRRQKNNPVLIGEAGVGKTAIVELFATKIIKNLVPFVLEGRTIISIDISRIVAGAKYRGDFELRLQRLLNEVLNQPNIIIFIDEIHNITGAGSAEGSLDAANILKPILSRSGFQCIGATTIKEYQRIEKDPALNRRFQPILVKEPTINETINILYGLRPSLEVFHNVEIHPSAIILAAELSARYIHDRFLPDKAIDLLDRAAAREVIKLTNITEGSVITSIINSSLKHIGTLRLEAFRRGDIASEFVFKEIENAYKNFLLKWIESPLNLSTSINKNVVSPITQELYNKMRLSVLKRIDELLFASNKSRFIINKFNNISNISSSKNFQIYNNAYFDLTSNNFKYLNLYRISLILFIDWNNKKIFKEIPNFNHIYKYLINLRQNNLYTSINKATNFNIIDAEIIEEKIEILSELEEKRIDTFKNYLLQLKPLIQKGIIESLKYSSQLIVSNEELSLIYKLLGHTTSTITFLDNLQDPILLKKANQLGNFTGLKKQIKQKEIQVLLAEITGIPAQTLSTGESQKLSNLESILHKAVIGQNEAVSAISKAIRRARLGIQKPNRPLASFLFCGPTGVGKTEVTKALAKTMFGATTDMIRFDMSEFMEKFTISRLIGSPPGYVGYDDGGQLTDAVRLKPYSVVLFDELEKAHSSILNILLQILEDGRLTDSQKRLIHFDNTIIIMTSNAAAEDIQQLIKKEQTNKISNNLESNTTLPNKTYKHNYSGVINFLKSPINENFLLDLKQQLKKELEISFRNLKASQIKDIIKLESSSENKTLSSKLKEVVLERLSTLFLPEFLNRLDDIIIFQPLKPEELRKICDIMIKEVIDRVKSKNINLSVDENVRSKLSKDGYNPLFGARPLRRLITKHVEDLISENMLKNLNSKTELNIKIILNDSNQIIIK